MRDRVVLKTISVSLPFAIGLMSWEARRTVGVSPKEHEQIWSEEAQQCAEDLGNIAGVED
jgi:hypothetical protein